MKVRIMSRAIFLCVLITILSHNTRAAPTKNELQPIIAPTNRPARPQMPASFDRQTVEQLIANIDKPQNSSILKVGYFLRRGQPALPVSEGFGLLKAAAEKEPIGTRRWFLLQSLRGFAAFRVAEADTAEGFAAYDLIFTHAADAAKAKAQYPLRQAISEFVSVVSGKLRDLGLSTDERTRETLFKAWTAYAVALGGQEQTAGSQSVEPNWTAAIEATKATDAFLPYVEKVLADASLSKNFGLLFAASAVVAPKDPNRALTVLLQAKPLLPQEKGKLEVNQAARFYETLVDLLDSQNKPAEAIAVQQERLGLLGSGQAKLLLLYKKNGDEAKVEQILAALNQSDADGREINKAASGLLLLSRAPKAPDTKAGEQAARLLSGYLSAARARDVEEELSARLKLSAFYLGQRKQEETKAILTFEPPKEPLSRRARSLLRDVERMNKQLQKAN